MDSVQWGEYRIEEIFEKVKCKKLNYKVSELPTHPIEEFDLPALTAGIQNQGLNSYVPREEADILKGVISVSANGANTGATFYQSKEFTVLQDAYAIDLINKNKISVSENAMLFLTGSIQKAIYGNYEWTNKAGWNRIKDNIIQLPIKNGEIDFAFMESFVANLEAQRAGELETYLSATGLKDYNLTIEEEKAIKEFENLNWEEKYVTEIFDVKNTRNILSRDIVENSGNTPYLCASIDNNAVSSYISYDEESIEKGNCVFIGGKTFVVTYQNKDFYSNDSHNLALYLIDQESITENNQLYLATCLKKSLGHKYSWGNSISNRKIQKDKFLIPMINNELSYNHIETFISAIKKLIIKDVVKWAYKKQMGKNKL